MNAITNKERAGQMLGVEGRFFAIVAASNGRILNQQFKATRYYKEGGRDYRITAELRFDDECNNGHETFAATADIRENGREYMGGCCHEEIARHFPELAPLIKWHLVSTDGPLHYIANTLYWLGFSGWCDGKTSSPPNLAHARSTAVWPDLPECYLRPDPDHRSAMETPLAQSVKRALVNRHDANMAAFKADMLGAGFVWPEHQPAQVTA